MSTRRARRRRRPSTQKLASVDRPKPPSPRRRTQARCFGPPVWAPVLPFRPLPSSVATSLASAAVAHQPQFLVASRVAVIDIIAIFCGGSAVLPPPDVVDFTVRAEDNSARCSSARAGVRCSLLRCSKLFPLPGELRPGRKNSKPRKQLPWYGRGVVASQTGDSEAAAARNMCDVVGHAPLLQCYSLKPRVCTWCINKADVKVSK